MKFKAIIFDLDGTLLDTIKDIADSMNTTLEKLGYPPHKIEDYYYFVGEGMEVLCRKVLPAHNNSSEIIAKCVELMKSEYQKNWSKTTRPYDGISELLNDLQRMGLKLAVHSNKPDEFTKTFVRHFFPETQFAIILGESKDFPRKPAPEGALHIARILKIPPGDILYIGDSGIDMKTGISAGMYPVGVLWGFRNAEELISNGAKRLIKKPPELLQLLDVK